MATKRETLEQLTRGEGCLGKAAMDEEIFILRGRDMIAADAVEWWAIQARMHGCSNDKVLDAKAVAERMTLTPGRKYPD